MEKKVHFTELETLYKTVDALASQGKSRFLPRIGISLNRKEGLSCIAEPYYQSVLQAGGLPVLIPVTTDVEILCEIIKNLDGIIFSGGGDLHPHFFKEEPIPELGEVDIYRDSYDFLLIRLAFNHQLPIMGICRGHQLINIAFGGSIYQDIYSQFSKKALVHSQIEPRHCATHKVSLEPSSRLSKLYLGEKTIEVNSFHHQAVKILAPEFLETALAPDGVNEGIEHQEYPIWGIQWHPEPMAVAGDEHMLDLFRMHISLAKTFASAKQLHQQIVTIDSHTDTPMIFPQNFNLGKKEGGKVNLPLMEEGFLDAVFMVAYLPQGARDAKSSEQATIYAKDRLTRIKEQEMLNPERMGIAVKPEDIVNLKKAGKKAVLLGIENGYAIGKNIDLLQDFKHTGVSYITLCHNKNNDICDSAMDVSEWNGLSPYGMDVIREMNRLGIMIDLSHASEKSFYDALTYSQKPVIASHSSVFALKNHPRNLKDDQLKALASNGGVVQICLYKHFLNANPDQASLTDVLNHIRYVIDLVGIDYVGIGSDFDGDGEVIGCRAANEMIQITMRLLNLGFDKESIRKIWGGNLLRVMNAVQSVSFN